MSQIEKHLGETIARKRRPSLLATGSLIGILLSMNQAWAADPSFTVFSPGNLLVSRSQYQGTAATVTIGETLPPVCGTMASCTGKATDNGAFPANGVINPATGNLQNVWNNDGPDGSFGVTSPIFLDQVSTNGVLVNTYPVDPVRLVTSFSSKSELALNLSTDGSVVTFVGYSLGSANATSLINNLDVSNSNTPGVNDPTNPVGTAFYRTVAAINSLGAVTYTDTNAYNGNNGRASVLANGLLYTVGNSNNGTANPANVTTSTGLEVVTPGSAPGTPVMVDPTLVTHAGDKAGKDSNFRGLTVSPGSALFFTKGSGSNGIDTVYTVNPGLPTIANAASSIISIPAGFPTALAKTAGINNVYPFGVWFANANTLYVADEGDGNLADAANSPFAGLQKWTLNSGTWSLAYVMQNGLSLGKQYGVDGYPISLDPAPAGLRNITGRVNSDGSVTIWAITSTVSTNGDEGADPNQLVTINDNLANTSAAVAQYEKFTLVETASYGNVLRGVSFTPGTAPGTTADAAVSLTFGSTSLTYPGQTNTTVCVAPATSTPATGVVQILDDATVLTTQPLEGNGCANWYISPGLVAGQHNMTAFYSGDSNNLSGTSAAVVINVAATQPYLSANCGNASFAFGGNYTCNVSVNSNAGPAQGSITYSFDGAAPVPLALVNGSAQFMSPTPAPGPHSVVIGFAAQGNWLAAASNTQNFTVNQATAQVQLAPSNYYPSAGTAENLTATVSSYSDGAVTAGSVTFFDNGAPLGGSIAVNAQGQAVWNIPAIAAGYHSFTAQYAGSVDFSASNSNYLSISAH